MSAMIKNLLLLALVLPVLPASTASASTAPAQPATQAMHLSSWQSEIVDGTIVGGTQSVTIVNPSASPINDIVFRVGAPPCDCTLTSASVSGGAVVGDVWTVGELAGGATATLDLVYESHE